ncbi:hypothetical protein ES703_07475 [subsurface metagenome]
MSRIDGLGLSAYRGKVPYRAWVLVDIIDLSDIPVVSGACNKIWVSGIILRWEDCFYSINLRKIHITGVSAEVHLVFIGTISARPGKICLYGHIYSLMRRVRIMGPSWPKYGIQLRAGDELLGLTGTPPPQPCHSTTAPLIPLHLDLVFPAGYQRNRGAIVPLGCLVLPRVNNQLAIHPQPSTVVDLNTKRVVLGVERYNAARPPHREIVGIDPGWTASAPVKVHRRIYAAKHESLPGIRWRAASTTRMIIITGEATRPESVADQCNQQNKRH